MSRGVLSFREKGPSPHESTESPNKKLFRVPANSRLDLFISETKSLVFERSRTTSTLTCNSKVIHDFGSISDSMVCGFNFSFASSRFCWIWVLWQEGRLTD